MIAGRPSPEAETLDDLALAYDYAMSEIPDQYLDVCFRRAVQAKDDNWLISGIDIRNAWYGLKEEIAAHEREQKQLRLSAAAESGICTACMGAGWLVDRHYPQEPKTRRCPYCEGPTPVQPVTREGRYTTLREFWDKHLAVCDGCDDPKWKYCHKGALPADFGWLQGATPPPPEQDVSQFGQVRRAQAQEPAAVEDEDDLPF